MIIKRLRESLGLLPLHVPGICNKLFRLETTKEAIGISHFVEQANLEHDGHSLLVSRLPCLGQLQTIHVLCPRHGHDVCAPDWEDGK